MRLLLLITVLALAGCSAAEQAMNADLDSRTPSRSADGPPTVDVTGTWDTRWGTMTLRQSDDGQVTGTYDDGGTIEGAVSGAVLTGYWTEPYANNTCDTRRAGTPHWGRVEFRFRRDDFEGGYTDCSNPMYSEGRNMGAEWNGRRVR